jgi:acid stress-induced BolA-like protein IbaG/YrbA
MRSKCMVNPARNLSLSSIDIRPSGRLSARITAGAAAVFFKFLVILQTLFMTPVEIEKLIAAGLQGCRVNVRSDDNTHFEALVISTEFAGKRPLQRHQMIYRALGDAMGGVIHALSIQALTPEEHAAG